MTILEHRLTENRDAIIQLANKYGMENVRVFGSVARGEDTEGSDIDLLVTPGPGRTLSDRCGFILDTQELLDCKLDVLNSRGLRRPSKDVILEEAKPL